MHNLILALIFLFICVLSGGYLFERFTAEMSSPPTSAPVPAVVAQNVYPANLTVSNKDGNELNIRLLGRNASHFHFSRKSDGRQFVYLLSDLSEESQEKLNAFPNEGIDYGANTNSRKSPKMTATDYYIANLKQEIARIDEECAALRADFKQTSSQVDRRTIMREYNGLRQDRAKFLQDIAERQ